VMRSGTGAGVRSRGFVVPAAGKTGTSHDGWFAGYTSQLLCIVWVGFDDNRELDLEGAHSALPIWAEFMKRALQYRPYRNVEPFTAPDGIVTVQIDPASGMPATPNCPLTRVEVYVAGTQPLGACPLHGGRNAVANVAGWDTAPQRLPEPPVLTPFGRDAAAIAQRHPAALPVPPAPASDKPPADEEKSKKKGFFRRLWGVFK